VAENSGHGAADPAPGADSAPGGWAERIAARSGWFAVSLGLLLAVATLLTTIWAGNLAAVVDLDAPLGLERNFRFQLVLIALISLSIWAHFHETATSRQQLAELRPYLDLRNEEVRALLGSFLDRTRPALSSMAGALFGGAVVIVSLPMGNVASPESLWNAINSWSLVVTAALFALMTVNADRSLRAGQFFSELGKNHMRVRLVDPTRLQPFARRGLNSARFWFIGSALAVLLVVSGSTPWITASIIVGTVAIGVISLLVPTVGVHQQLRVRKQRELARVRALIEERSATLLNGAATSNPDSELSALLAYEARIDDVREWPFDTSNLLRFALFLLIPLASWLGGALVERLVDAALS